MPNPPQGRYKNTGEPASNKIQMRRSFESAEIGNAVRTDDTTAAENRPMFAPSVDRHIIDRDPGFGQVNPTVEEHQTDRGLKTLSSDSRKAPLPEQGVKIDLYGAMPRNNEHIIGKTIRDNPENTVT